MTAAVERYRRDSPSHNNLMFVGVRIVVLYCLGNSSIIERLRSSVSEIDDAFSPHLEVCTIDHCELPNGRFGRVYLSCLAVLVTDKPRNNLFRFSVYANIYIGYTFRLTVDANIPAHMSSLQLEIQHSRRHIGYTALILCCPYCYRKHLGRDSVRVGESYRRRI